jgi:hypothetical protein
MIIFTVGVIASQAGGRKNQPDHVTFSSLQSSVTRRICLARWPVGSGDLPVIQLFAELNVTLNSCSNDEYARCAPDL